MDKRQKILLIGGGAAVVLLLIIGSVAQYMNRPHYTTKTTVTTDPVTGEQIVNVEGKSPEKSDTSAAPTTVGADAIYALFMDDEVFRRLEQNVFQVVYKDYSFVRIAREPVTKKITNTDGITVITVEFNVYLDTNNSKKDHHVVSFNQQTGDIVDTFEGDYTTTKATITTSTLGDL